MFLLTPLTPWCDTIPPSPFSHTDARTTPPLCFSSAHNCTHTYKHALTRTFQYQTNNNNKHKHTRIRSNTQTNNNNTQARTYAYIPTPKPTTTIHTQAHTLLRVSCGSGAKLMRELRSSLRSTASFLYMLACARPRSTLLLFKIMASSMS